jgi:hypothetical protein
VIGENPRGTGIPAVFGETDEAGKRHLPSDLVTLPKLL